MQIIEAARGLLLCHRDVGQVALDRHEFVVDQAHTLVAHFDLLVEIGANVLHQVHDVELRWYAISTRSTTESSERGRRFRYLGLRESTGLSLGTWANGFTLLALLALRV